MADCVKCLVCWQVSPHEFMQGVMRASNKKFTIEHRADPVEFWSWFLNSLHLALTGMKRKKPSVISRYFQACTSTQSSHIHGNCKDVTCLHRTWSTSLWGTTGLGCTSCMAACNAMQAHRAHCRTGKRQAIPCSDA